MCVRFAVPLYKLTTREPMNGYSAISRRPLTAEARVQCQAIPRDICVDQNDTGHVILRVLGLPLSVSFHQCTILIHLSPTPDNLNN